MESNIGATPALHQNNPISELGAPELLDEVLEHPTKCWWIILAHLAGFELTDKQLWDTIPQPLVPLINLDATEGLMQIQTGRPEDDGAPSQASQAMPMMAGVIDTPTNAFGVFQRYRTVTIPAHDPEARINLAMLSNVTGSINKGTPDAAVFELYPNESSFLLGEWYWSQGSQTSQRNFKKLLEVINSPNFSPLDIQSTNRTKVNRQLGVNNWDEAAWVDKDAGWCHLSVKILVPFSHTTGNPGVQDYIGGDFHHWPLMSVIRNKLTNAHDAQHFYFEPHELLWHPPHMDEEIRLQGKLYTSSAFHAAHQDLQSSPCKPGCDLPRVIVALMFWSDAMHLSTFGSAKLWPVYMFFGNESKYCHCMPTQNLCEHVAYFENVSYAHTICLPGYQCIFSFLTHSKTLPAGTSVVRGSWMGSF